MSIFKNMQVFIILNLLNQGHNSFIASDAGRSETLYLLIS